MMVFLLTVQILITHSDGGIYETHRSKLVNAYSLQDCRELDYRDLIPVGATYLSHNCEHSI